MGMCNCSDCRVGKPDCRCVYKLNLTQADIATPAVYQHPAQKLINLQTYKLKNSKQLANSKAPKPINSSTQKLILCQAI